MKKVANIISVNDPILFLFWLKVRGIGYYHLHTREAYDIILDRAIVKKKDGKMEMICGCAFMMTVFLPLGVFFCIYGKKKVAHYDDLIEIITLRKNAAGPSSDIDVPDELLGRVKKISKEWSKNNYATSADYTYGHYFVDNQVGAGCG